MEELLTDGKYTGIAAFVLFGIVFKRRVAIWNQNERHDIINEHASWANGTITDWAVIEVISCNAYGGNIYLHHDNVAQMNHWVAGVDEEKEILERLAPETQALVGAGKQSPHDDNFYALYSMFHNIGIVQTVTDGDCGIDAMCLILGWSRTLDNRKSIRRTLVKFCAKHQGNRALIAMLASCGELSTSLGYHDLITSGRELFQHHCHGIVEGTNHCHGGDLAVSNDHPLEIAVPGDLDFIDQQILQLYFESFCWDDNASNRDSSMRKIHSMLRSKWIAAKREKKRARDRKCKAMLRKYEEELAHDRKRLRKAKYLVSWHRNNG